MNWNWLKAIIGAIGRNKPKPQPRRYHEGQCNVGASRWRLEVWEGPTFETVADGSGYALFDLPGTSPLGVGSTLTIMAEGWETFSCRCELPQAAGTPEAPTKLIFEYDGHRGSSPIVLQQDRLMPAESGQLSVDGAYLRTPDGSMWDYRGATLLMLFARFWRGESIATQIRWMKEGGFNVARILIAGHPGIFEWSDVVPSIGCSYVNAWRDDPNFWSTYGRFLDLMAKNGLRVETTCVSDESKSFDDWVLIIRRTYEACGARWNALVEWVNEPFSRDGRMQTMQALIRISDSIDRRGVISSYGLDLKGVSEEEGNYLPCPMLDYVTARTGRNPSHFWQNPHELWERSVVQMRAHGKGFIVDDEPLGGAETVHGERTTDVEMMGCHFAVARLFGGGATFHCDAGLNGLAPDKFTEPVQTSMAALVSEMWRFLPGDLQAGGYLAPHLGGWPVVWVAEYDSGVNHAYGKNVGPAYVVNVKSRADWVAIGKDGWIVDGVGPRPWVARCIR